MTAQIIIGVFVIALLVNGLGYFWAGKRERKIAHLSNENAKLLGDLCRMARFEADIRKIYASHDPLLTKHTATVLRLKEQQP